MQNAHTRKTAYMFCILQLIYKEDRTEPTVFQNRNRGFSQTEPKPNLKNPFRTSLVRVVKLQWTAKNRIAGDNDKYDLCLTNKQGNIGHH